MKRISATILFCALAGALQAQTANPLSTELKGSYTRIKTNFIKAAEKMPEENYSFKPTPDMQTFQERVAHIAVSSMGPCSTLKGEQKSIDAKTLKTKADVVAALKDTFATCDAVVDSMTDADAVSMVSGRGGQRSKLAMMYGLVGHTNELYGYICVYMRLKGVVPPSSEGR
ncbi:MAG TPA: DinB family protein [Bryobacteraceae bacterium]|nr:DinB family protein [Bryobacteraceae bacterium]